jgi:bacterioferritin
MAGEFLSDVMELRRRAREHVERGAVTDTYGLDVETSVKVLNEALATEVVCTLRYMRHYYMAQGIHSVSVADEFREHAREEQDHADRLAQRIVQLGGEPDLSPEGLATRSHAEYVEGDTLIEMIREDLIAERVAIESYTEMVRYFGDRDPTSRRLLEEILAKEEEHAEDLNSLLRTLGHAPRERERPARRGAGQGVDQPEASAVPSGSEPRDLGYGASHGYDATHGGPSGPGDEPAREGATEEPTKH